MDYSLYFETLQRTALQQVDSWAKIVMIILVSGFVLGVFAFLISLAIATSKHDYELTVPLIIGIIVVCFCLVGLIFSFIAPTHDSGEYEYEALVADDFNLVTFEKDERFTDIEYSNGKLKFKSYEYIEEIN